MKIDEIGQGVVILPLIEYEQNVSVVGNDYTALRTHMRNMIQLQDKAIKMMQPLPEHTREVEEIKKIIAEAHQLRPINENEKNT